MSRWTEGEPLTVDMEHFGEWRESQPEEPPVEEEVYTKEDMHAKETLHETEKIISETENKPAAGKMSVQDSMKKQQENRTQITRSAQKYDSELAATELPARNFFPQYQWTDIWEQFLKIIRQACHFRKKILPVLKLN